MAYCDYLHCALCDAKAIYDANVNYDHANAGDIIVLCKTCIKTAEIIVRDKRTKSDLNVEHGMGWLNGKEG